MAKRTEIGRAEVSETISFWKNMRIKLVSFYSSQKVWSLIPWSTRKPVISKALFQAPVQHLPLAMTSPSSLSLVELLSSTFRIFSLFWSKTCDRRNKMTFFLQNTSELEGCPNYLGPPQIILNSEVSKMTAVSESDLAIKCLEFCQAQNGQYFQVLPHFGFGLFFLLWLKGVGLGQEEAKPLYN